MKRAYLKSQRSLEASDLDPSVLDAATLEAIGKSEIKTVTVFDNLIRIPRPVPLKVLKRIGCGQPNDLVTTHQINPDQLESILSEGFAYD